MGEYFLNKGDFKCLIDTYMKLFPSYRAAFHPAWRYADKINLLLFS